MKKAILIYGLILLNLTCNAGLLRWDGQGGDGLWENKLNWDNDQVPGPTDDIILDNTYLPGNYTVFLPGGNVQVSLNSLSIIPAAAVINCILPASNTASPGLLLTGTGDAFILSRGAVFLNASGASSGTPITVTASGSFRINNGGHYIHRTARGHTDFLVSRLSTAAGTEEGIFEFDVPGTASYTISVSGRSFGRLIFSAAAAGANRTYTGAGINPVSIRGGLEIRSNATFSYGANTDTIMVAGNSLIHPGGTLNIANGANSGVIRFSGSLDDQGLITETGSSPGAAIIMAGTIPQSLSCTGNISEAVKVVIDNPSGITLTTPVHLAHGLEFIQGKLNTTTANLLSLGAGAFCTGGSPAGFIYGPVKKTGSAAFEFPVGAGTIYAPVGIGAGELESDEFIAEYKRANPQSAPGLGNTCISPINHISYVEYWNLSQVTGNSARKVTLSVSPYSFAYEFEALVVARAENGQWLSEGGMDYVAGPSSASYVTGNFVSATTVEKFGAFTLGSLINQMLNPLPLPLEYFTAKRAGDHILLNWKTGICPANGIRSVLEHAKEDEAFRYLTALSADDLSCSFIYKHYYTDKGPHLYRLSIIDASGNVLHQKQLALQGETSAGKKEFYLSIINDQRDLLNISVCMPAGKAAFFIIDGTGRAILSGELFLSGREERISIPIRKYLTGGLYRLVAISGDRKFSTAFIR